MFQKLALVATIGAGVAIGLLWPTAQRSTAAAAAAANNAPEVVIERNSDHHYYADASVNGHQMSRITTITVVICMMRRALPLDSGTPFMLLRQK